MFTIPDKGEGDNDIQSILFQEYIDSVIAGLSGLDCVLVGGAVTPNALLALNGAKAATLSNGVMNATAASTTITIGAAHATNPRIDLVVINSAGAWAVRAGTAATAPKPPAKSANDVLMAAVFVPALDATIGAGQIIDMRPPQIRGPILIDKVTGAVTFNTTNAIQTYYTKVIPDGLFLAGRVLRFTAGGNFLPNSGTPTFTYTIAYGGTTLHASTSAAHTADADRHPWTLHFEIVAQANNDQAMAGLITYPTITGIAAPASGIGNLATATQIAISIGGSAAVDSDAADRTLTVQVTMSVSNSACEFVLEYATLEIL